MRVVVRKLTDEALMRTACEATMKGKESKVTLDQIYRCLHSPARTQIFWIEMKDIPSFVSVHLVRHSVGVTHYVQSNRDDRGGTGEETRDTPVNHSMLINAEALINMARKRKCAKTHCKTQEAMYFITLGVAEVDPALAEHMVPECEFRNGYCPELRSCGRYNG